ncbi:DUF998 domain-containing protein [Rhodococcus sp. NBC_00297]|uniref:DUF998 domain-containing protein n=1 Tax=Rhodococcus sp. NBC_00297 TaxID=2976005 RepID=UPI002E2E7606|nr:DUF998 domain-containing protein [Rhodococcus sp. NBC_00297]
MSPLRAWSDPLAEHIVGTYFALRAAMAIMAVGLPLLLVAWSLLDPDLPVLGSMSEYYYSPARDVFVGVLSGTGIALICYRGHGTLENGLLNAAGAFLVVVALVPTDPPGQSDFGLRMTVHAVAAVAFFVSFAVSVWRCADDTLDPSRDSERRIRRYRRAYRVVAVVVVVAPASALALVLVLRQGALAVLVVEAVAVMTFGVYWALKSYELRGTELAEQP